MTHTAPQDGDIAPARPAKRLFVKTYGCQMNVYDSERMADVLAPEGYVRVEDAESADLVVLNTCHIRERAVEKVYSEVGRLKALREARLAEGGGRLGIAVAGCVAQAEGAEIMVRAPAVDIVVGPQAYQALPDLLASPGRARSERVAADFAPTAKFDAPARARRASGPTAFLTVQEGCDKFCTFCVVPYTRGAEYGRPVEAVLAEARGLTEQGVREITLLGQNVNAYAGEAPGGGTWPLARLLHALAAIPGLARIRYTTSHPRDIGEDLIAAHGELEALMPYLHLPVQSGSDRVLKAMNRGHTVRSYLALIERIRAARGDIALSGDFIVGFPGETEEDFQATLDLVDEVAYVAAFSFKYSPRPGTPAASRDDQVPEPVKAERLARLQARLDAHRHAFDAAQVGRRLPVLFEKAGRREGQLIGRSPYLQAVWAEAPPALLGRVVDVDIETTGPNSLQGRLAAPAEVAA
jgi:tRNA-2-methylthio-N6-dimethylallyladenosine synthase